LIIQWTFEPVLICIQGICILPDPDSPQQTLPVGIYIPINYNSVVHVVKKES
jgi:hypothetical protein